MVVVVEVAGVVMVVNQANCKGHSRSKSKVMLGVWRSAHWLIRSHGSDPSSRTCYNPGIVLIIIEIMQMWRLGVIGLTDSLLSGPQRTRLL